MPELKKNNLKFGYRITFKYEGMLAHSFVRFYVVTKFILPSVNDLEFLPIDFNERCNYLTDDLVHDHNSNKEQISCYNCTVHNILTNDISLILLDFPKSRVEKRSIIASLIIGFISLAYEGISSYLYSKRQKALHKAFIALENKVHLQQNKTFHF